MKTFVLYVCAFSLIYFTSAKTLQPQPRLNRKILAIKEDLDECISRTDITADEMFSIFDILNDRYKEPGQEESVRKHGCIFHCVLEKVGAMEGSEIIVDKMQTEVRKRIAEQSRNKVSKMVDNCINTTKHVTEKCQKTFDLVTCLLKAELKDLQQNSRVNEEHTSENEHITPESEHLNNDNNNNNN